MPSSNTTSNVNFAKTETFRMVHKKRLAGSAIEEGSQSLSVYTLASDPKLLLAGTKAGGVVYWQLGETNKHGGQKKERQSHVLSSASKSPHNGMITALCYSEQEEFVRWVKDSARGLLFSGGADRLIKVWDVWAYMDTGDEPLMQTLAGHTHTVTGLVDSGIEGGIISSSLDKTIKIWQPEGGMKLMLNPFFVCVKTLRVGGEQTWVNSMCLRGGEEWALFCGDSEGSISVYENHGKSISVGISKKWNNIHKLAISDVVLIPEQNFLVSCSFDCVCQVLDSMSGAVFVTISNHNRTRFTGACWDSGYEQLLLCDALGNLEAHNIYHEKKIGTECVADSEGVVKLPTKISGRINFEGKHGGSSDVVKTNDPVISGLVWVGGEEGEEGGGERFIMMLPSVGCMQEWQIRRNNYCVQFPGHDDEVVGVLVVAQEEERKGVDSEEVVDGFRDEESAVFSCSLDNTIRCWDDYDVTERFSIPSRSSELSSMAYVSGFNLIVTGHDDGTVKFWNPDSASSHVEHDHDNTVTCACHVRTDRVNVVVTGSYGGSCCIYDLRKKREGGKTWLAAELREEAGEGEEGKSSGADVLSILRDGGETLNSEVLCVWYHEDTGLLLSGCNDGSVKAWNLLTGQIVKKWKSGHDGCVGSISSDGYYVFTGGGDGVIGIWNLAGEEWEGEGAGGGRVRGTVEYTEVRREGEIQAHKEAVTALVVTPHTGYLISAGGDGKIIIWDWGGKGGVGGEGKGDGFGLRVMEHHGEIPRCLAFRERPGGDEISVYMGTKERNLLKFSFPKDLRETVREEFERKKREEEKRRKKEEERLKEEMERRRWRGGGGIRKEEGKEGEEEEGEGGEVKEEGGGEGPETT
ncbi:hypothetical protein TrCOL_g11435 [Triparma columacea]|uniref:Uncharacterized protein n=1 Tax=Triparma columacea TaxID=722753 RepID=A0A9W7GLQ8_9STRA|nr:hypothetical protein TrCOL_g11435 [Triparma columacea]